LKLSGQSKIARMQGSATLAIEISISNFVFGKVLVINSGYYSNRMHDICKSYMKNGKDIASISYLTFDEAIGLNDSFDWVIACSVETSRGTLRPLIDLNRLAKSKNAKLMVDATASIGLEKNHHFADLIAFSSCKGLFGLTGASFVAYSTKPNNYVSSLFLNIDNHLEKKVTGPYHSICSLYNVLPKIDLYRETVLRAKKDFINRFRKYLNVSNKYQPLLCTFVTNKIISNDPRSVLYVPRDLNFGSIVCHLGEAHRIDEKDCRINNYLEADYESFD